MAQNGLSVLANESNKLWRNLDILGTWTGPIISCKAGATTLHDQNTFQRCVIHGAPDAKPKWGARLFNWKNGVFQGLSIFDIWWEHGIYANIIGGLLIRASRFYDIGAQGVQIVWRSEETYDTESWRVVGDQIVSQCSFERVGLTRGDGRRSYVLSFFGKQAQQSGGNPGPRTRWDCPVIIQDTTIDNRAEWTPKLRGAVMAEHRPALHILGCNISHDGIADRPLVLSHQNDLVVIDRNHFKGNKQIDLHNPQEVHVTANTGNVMLRIDGDEIGPISQDFHWTR